jgi:hypothetical protein
MPTPEVVHQHAPREAKSNVLTAEVAPGTGDDDRFAVEPSASALARRTAICAVLTPKRWRSSLIGVHLRRPSRSDLLVEVAGGQW